MDLRIFLANFHNYTFLGNIAFSHKIKNEGPKYWHVIVAIRLNLILGQGSWHLHVWEENLQGEWNIFLQSTAWYIQIRVPRINYLLQDIILMTSFRPELVVEVHIIHHSRFSARCTVTYLRALPEFWRKGNNSIKIIEQGDGSTDKWVIYWTLHITCRYPHWIIGTNKQPLIDRIKTALTKLMAIMYCQIHGMPKNTDH